MSGPWRGSSLTLRLLMVAGAAGLGCDGVIDPVVPDPEESDCPYHVNPKECPQPPAKSDNFIAGIILERTSGGTRPRNGHHLWTWVQLPNGSGYSAGRIYSDADGLYRFLSIPRALFILQAFDEAYDQPCASIVQADSAGVTADIEVVSRSRPIVLADPPAPALVGVVYENTPAGRQPVAGARVFFETRFEHIAATTTTDELGRYTLCRLPDIDTFVTPYMPGYIVTPRSVAVSGIMEMELEMKRQ